MCMSRTGTVSKLNENEVAAVKTLTFWEWEEWEEQWWWEGEGKHDGQELSKWEK